MQGQMGQAQKLTVGRFLLALVGLVLLVGGQAALLAFPVYGLANMGLRDTGIQFTYWQTFWFTGALQVLFLPVFAIILVVLIEVRRTQGGRGQGTWS